MVHFTFKNGLAGKSLSAHNSFKSFNYYGGYARYDRKQCIC